MAESAHVTGERTEFGFRWGPADVVRCCEHKGHVWIMVRGARQQVTVRVTPSGLIRVDQIEPGTLPDAMTRPASEPGLRLRVGWRFRPMANRG